MAVIYEYGPTARSWQWARANCKALGMNMVLRGLRGPSPTSRASSPSWPRQPAFSCIPATPRLTLFWRQAKEHASVSALIGHARATPVRQAARGVARTRRTSTTSTRSPPTADPKSLGPGLCESPRKWSSATREIKDRKVDESRRPCRGSTRRGSCLRTSSRAIKKYGGRSQALRKAPCRPTPRSAARSRATVKSSSRHGDVRPERGSSPVVMQYSGVDPNRLAPAIKTVDRCCRCPRASLRASVSGSSGSEQKRGGARQGLPKAFGGFTASTAFVRPGRGDILGLIGPNGSARAPPSTCRGAPPAGARSEFSPRVAGTHGARSRTWHRAHYRSRAVPETSPWERCAGGLLRPVRDADARNGMGQRGGARAVTCHGIQRPRRGWAAAGSRSWSWHGLWPPAHPLLWPTKALRLDNPSDRPRHAPRSATSAASPSSWSTHHGRA